MKLEVLKTRLSKAVKEKDSYFLMAIGSIAVNVLLGLTLLTHHANTRTILIPTGFKQSFWVDSNGVSASALAEMTRYFATLKLNITPDNSDYQIHQILKYTNPRTYGALKAELEKEAGNLKSEGLTMSFYPVNVKANAEKLQATITGDLAYYVGNQQTNNYRVSYLATYSYDNGRLYLNSFQEVDKHG